MNANDVKLNLTRSQSPQHEVLGAFSIGAWQACLPKHPSEKDHPRRRYGKGFE